MERFCGKVVLVTGASKNIGRAIFERMAREGAAVLGVGRSLEAGLKIAESIRATGKVADFIACDVTDAEQLRVAVRHAVETFGGIDIVVNNAAATQFIRDGSEGAIVDESYETFDQFMKIGVYAPFLLAKFAIPEMLKRGGGSFINISSIAAVKAVKGSTAYGPSKAALESLTNQIAVDYGDRGIRAISVRVGPIRTDENHKLHDHPEAGPMLRDGQMLSNRIGVPEDVANAVAFAASGEASFITGSVLSVEAGQVMKQYMPDLHAVFAKK